jgi:glycosyltransferase involved in cell wall biosynthesis
MRKSLSIQADDFVVIYAGKLTEAKGGKFLAEALKRKFVSKKKIVFVIVGSCNDSYGEEVDKILASSENRIIRFPTQDYFGLPKYFQMSDLCLFPKQVSLSFFDAQACGLPVLSALNNVNEERLQYKNGFNFIQDNVDDFRGKIELCANMNESDFIEMSSNAIRYIRGFFDYGSIADQYTQILQHEVERFYREH